ncbi:MAG TPA: hypothetical protein VNT20_09070 [Flavisolibacter sp.]|nr:hypothetical protein [Flavisolibacter sp.]
MRLTISFFKVSCALPDQYAGKLGNAVTKLFVEITLSPGGPITMKMLSHLMTSLPAFGVLVKI